MTRQEEKMIAIQLRDSEIVLEGIFIRGEGGQPPGAVIAPPHPLYGGSMDSPVLNEVAHACKRAGYATIRFNWRGVGASSGAPSGESADADADYGAALDYLEETVPGVVVAAGYSFGAATAVRSAVGHPRVRRLVLVAPPPALLDTDLLQGFGGSVLIVAGDDDRFAPLAELESLVADHPRRRLVVVPEADHFFMVGLVDIGRAVSEWLDPV
jgi:alpha/beta superfamily hydrolase